MGGAQDQAIGHGERSGGGAVLRCDRYEARFAVDGAEIFGAFAGGRERRGEHAPGCGGERLSGARHVAHERE